MHVAPHAAAITDAARAPARRWCARAVITCAARAAPTIDITGGTGTGVSSFSRRVFISTSGTSFCTAMGLASTVVFSFTTASRGSGAARRLVVPMAGSATTVSDRTSGASTGAGGTRATTTPRSAEIAPSSGATGGWALSGRATPPWRSRGGTGLAGKRAPSAGVLVTASGAVRTTMGPGGARAPARLGGRRSPSPS